MGSVLLHFARSSNQDFASRTDVDVTVDCQRSHDQKQRANEQKKERKSELESRADIQLSDGCAVSQYLLYWCLVPKEECNLLVVSLHLIGIEHKVSERT